MTREEAVERLKNSTMRDTLSDQWKEAYKIAIQALSQEPCDDAISRQDAIDAIYEHEFSNWCDKDEVSTILNDLPPVMQKSGKWEDLHRCWVCSECGQQTHIEHKYCPNCGAKMESEDKE